MKNLLFVLSTVLILSSCTESVKENLVIKGNIKGLKKGMLYLQHVPDSTLVVIDSLAINGDSNFSFNVNLESPEICYLSLDKNDNRNIGNRITFFAEPGVITINSDRETFDTSAKITGSKTQLKLEEYRKVMYNTNLKTMAILYNATQLTETLDQRAKDSIETLKAKNKQRGYANSINFALNNKDSYIAPYIATNQIPDANKKYLDSIYNSLTPEVANSKYGLELKTLLK